MNNAPIITIDGPSGSGKGTLCKLLADRLGYHLLDSGALYRLVALAAEHHGVSAENGVSRRRYCSLFRCAIQGPR